MWYQMKGQLTTVDRKPSKDQSPMILISTIFEGPCHRESEHFMRELHHIISPYRPPECTIVVGIKESYRIKTKGDSTKVV